MHLLCMRVLCHWRSDDEVLIGSLLRNVKKINLASVHWQWH
jgi:hypothetical protein